MVLACDTILLEAVYNTELDNASKTNTLNFPAVKREDNAQESATTVILLEATNPILNNSNLD